MFRYRLTTNPGLESIVADDLCDTLGAGREEITLRPGAREGRVDLLVPQPIEPEVFARLFSVYHVVAIDAETEVAGLERMAPSEALAAIRVAVEPHRLPGLDRRARLAVRCKRVGRHAIRSPDVEREVGTLLTAREGCGVDLDHPTITVRVDLEGSRVAIGRLVTPAGADRRFSWAYRPRVALKSVVAYALLRLARGDRGGALLDPFCGSGTVPLVALASGLAASPPNGTGGAAPWSHLFASDRAAESVAGTRANLAWNGYPDRAVVRCADARRLVAPWAGRGVSTIVCNPPYGVRLGRSISFPGFYGAFLDGAARVLPDGGRLVMMASRRRGALNAVLKERPEWRTLHVRVIETGGVYPAIFVLERH